MRAERLRAMAAGVALSVAVGVCVGAVVLSVTIGAYQLFWTR